MNRAQVVPFMLHSYSEVVARALIIEREMEEAQRLRSKNSRFDGSKKLEQDFKRKKVTHPQQQPGNQSSIVGLQIWPRDQGDVMNVVRWDILGGSARNFNDLHTSHLNGSFSKRTHES